MTVQIKYGLWNKCVTMEYDVFECYSIFHHKVELINGEHLFIISEDMLPRYSENNRMYHDTLKCAAWCLQLKKYYSFKSPILPLMSRGDSELASYDFPFLDGMTLDDMIHLIETASVLGMSLIVSKVKTAIANKLVSTSDGRENAARLLSFITNSLDEIKDGDDTSSRCLLQ